MDENESNIEQGVFERVVEGVYADTIVAEGSEFEKEDWIRDEGIAHGIANNEVKGFPKDEQELLSFLMGEEASKRLFQEKNGFGKKKLDRLQISTLREQAKKINHQVVSMEEYYFVMNELEDSINPDRFSPNVVENWINYGGDCVWGESSDLDGLNSLFMIPKNVGARYRWFENKMNRAIVKDFNDDIEIRKSPYNPEEIMWKDLMRRLYEEYPDKIGCSFISGELILSISSGKFKTEISKRGVILINEEKGSFSREHYSCMDSDEGLQRFYGMTRRVLEQAEIIPFYKD
ncbi:hypothetical protein K8R14_00395 [bacterium]|nr:hypothetical protein [bacterium]